MRAVTLALASLVTVSARGYPRGYIRSTDISHIPVKREVSLEEIAAAPDKIDWSEQGATTAIKDQGTCGSCWAFATTETVESAVWMAEGSVPTLSTEQLVDCDKTSKGCDGGDIPEGARYYESHGVSSAENYPDKSSDGGNTLCTWNDDSVVAVTNYSFALFPCGYEVHIGSDCSSQDEDKLAAALAKYGPLGICINSGFRQDGDWADYTGGVLSEGCDAKPKHIDHCVQLVGYDKTADEPYWKVRNSWGSDWGEDGYIRLAYRNNNTCCVACEAVAIDAHTIG